jgi:D-alanine-D-alanine ligase
MTRRRRVAVLMGGRSSEHPISLASGRSVVAALDPKRYEVVTLEIDRGGRWSLPSGHVPEELVPVSDTETSLPQATSEDAGEPGQSGRRSVSDTGISRPQLPVPGTSNEIAAALGDVEVVLPILHGPFGEDGRLQGLLEMADVAYVGADHAASALCMDKDLFKAVMRDQGIPVTRNITLRAGSAAGKAGDTRPENPGAGSAAGKAGDTRPENPGAGSAAGKAGDTRPENPGAGSAAGKAGDTRPENPEDGSAAENPFGYPVFVKPARLGSSVGITKAHDEKELAAAVELAFEHDEKVLVEEFVSGIEVEVGVLGNRKPFASLVGEIVVTHNAWYDWAAKYDEGEMDLVVPARITDEQTLRVQQLAVQAFVATECEGLARVDCFVRDDGEVLINELNTMPGFTATSVYAKLFEASGIGYGDLLERLIDLALERRERRARLKF